MDSTQEYFSSVKGPRIFRKVQPSENIRSVTSLNEFMNKSSADLVGFVTNGLLVTPD
jgi:hypothetical protein